MNRIFLIFIFIPLLLSAHIQDERLFKTLRVPAAAILLLDRSGSMYNETETFNVDVELLHRSFNSGVPDVENFSAWFDDTQYPYNYPYNDMNMFVGDPANGDWILNVIWEEPGFRPRSCDLDLTWTLRICDASGWHEYAGGTYSWHDLRDLQERNITISVSGLGDVDDVECYVEYTTGNGLKIDHVGVHLKHTPGVGETSNRIKDALLVIHSLLDVNSDGLVDGNDEFPINLGQGFFDDSRVFVGDDKSFAYNANNHKIRADEPNTYNNPVRWDQVSKTWVDDLTGWDTLYTDAMGTPVETIWEHINTTEMDGSTPNGMLVDSAVKYIAEYRNAHPELWCMKFSVVLVTDGQPNVPRNTCNPSDAEDPGGWDPPYDYYEDVLYGAKDLVRVAYNAFHGDNDTIAGPDSIRVFAVGFGTGITDECANTLNWTARWGGTWADSALMSGNDMAVDASSSVCCGSANPRTSSLTGYAYIAEDAKDLSNALISIFMGIESQASQSYTSAEVTSVEEEFLSTEYQSRLYVASFLPDTTPVWNGELRAMKLTTGVINLDDIDEDILIWSAGDSLADDSSKSRPIYGIKSGGMFPFDTSNFSASDLDVSSTDLLSAIGRIRDGDTEDSLGELGDIFHSSPLRIQSPNYFYEDEGWDSFYNVMGRERSSLIYAGGNDGMLHVFADTIYGQGGKGGHEIAGIIPMNFVPKVKNLLTYHDYFVDGDPMAADVWFPADESDSTKEWKEWHTILIATQGEGGNSFTAFDATDPLNETPHSVNSLNFLFDAWQSNTLKGILGRTTSAPIMYKVGVDWPGHTGRFIDRFYGFMGGGQFPDPLDLSIVDSILAGSVKGNKIIAFDVWKAANLGIDGNFICIPAAESEGDTMQYPFVSSPSIINIDPQFGNRYDFLFIPDAAGQLWFVDLRLPNPSEWKARKIFQPPLPASSDPAQIYYWHPAYYRPLIWKDPAFGGYWIAYGTGNRSNVFDESAERFYAIHYEIDAFNVDSLIPLYYEDTLGIPGDPTNCGWRLELTHDREKVVTPAVYFQDSLEFYTFSPGGSSTVGPCDIGGQNSTARSYSMHIRTGGSGNPEGVDVGSGMPQPPSYSFSISGEGKKIIQTGGKIEVLDIGSFMSFRQHILWKDEDRD
ncbi:hypothetical protein JXI42_13080 [bacterium]|nr:hypothetical protein [bacterium]